MAIRVNTRARIGLGPQAERPVAPDMDGYIYSSPTELSVYDAVASAWRTAGGGASTGVFFVGPLAQYTTIQAGVDAAAAAGGGSVVVAEGQYVEDVTVPVNISISAASGLGSVKLTGNIDLIGSPAASPPTIRSLYGLYVIGSIVCGGVGPVSSILIIDRCIVTPSVAGDALSATQATWAVFALTSQFGVSDGNAVANVSAGTFVIDAANCKFSGSPGKYALKMGNAADTFSLSNCMIDKPIYGLGGGTVRLTNPEFSNSDPCIQENLGGVNLTVNGIVIGVTGKLTNGAGTIVASSGSYFGSYYYANLPIIQSNGAYAYCRDGYRSGEGPAPAIGSGVACVSAHFGGNDGVWMSDVYNNIKVSGP